MFNLNNSYQYKLNSMPRGKDYVGQITNNCEAPLRSLTIDLESNCFLCSCDGWLPIPIGKVQDFNSFNDVFSSPNARIIQKDIQDKKFTWCAVDHCGIKSQDIRYMRYEIAINIDESCNLKCPSCRRESIMHTQGSEFERKLKDINTIISWLQNFNESIHIVLTGNGDPLASHIIRPLIKNYQPKDNQVFTFVTNGLLIKKHLAESPIFSQIKNYRISVDAGSDASYSLTRGGSWQVLLENFEFLNQHNRQELVTLNFCVQKNNYQDIPKFIELCRRYKFYGHIHHLDDWGTWPDTMPTNPDTWTIKNGSFLNHNVLDNLHPEHNNCRDIVKSEIKKLNDNKILFGNRLKELLSL
jgi:organic radical activating enzyme